MTETIEVNGVRLAYDVWGQHGAPPILLLHGGGGDRSSWAETALELAATHRVYAPDMRGHGDSDWPSERGFEPMRDDVLAFLDALDLDHVAIVGHSMGGTVAWLVAEKGTPRLDRLVIVDSPPPRERDEKIVLDPPGPDERLAFDWAALEVVIGQVNDPDPAWWDGLTSVGVPVLVLAGGPASPVDQADLAEAAATVPDGRLVTIPGGHHLHRTHPADFVAAVRAFAGG